MTDVTNFQMSESLKTTHERLSKGSPEVDDFSHIILKEDGKEIKIDYSNKREYILKLYEVAKAKAKEEDPENFVDQNLTDEELEKFPINTVLSALDHEGEDVAMEFDQPAYMQTCREYHKEVKRSRNQLRDELFAFYELDDENDDNELLWDEAFQVSPGKFEVIAEAFGKMIADTNMQRGDFETPVVEEEVTEETTEETTEE